MPWLDDMAVAWLVLETTAARRLRTNSWNSVSIHVLVERRGSSFICSKQAFHLPSNVMLCDMWNLSRMISWAGREKKTGPLTAPS